MGLLIQNTGRTQSPVNIYQVTKPSHETSSESGDPLNTPIQDMLHLVVNAHEKLTEYKICHKLYDWQQEIIKQQNTQL